MAHLIEEVLELDQALRAGGDVSDELADVAILTLNIAHMVGVDLGDAVAQKHRLNERRVWSEPDSLGRCHAVGVEEVRV